MHKRILTFLLAFCVLIFAGCENIRVTVTPTAAENAEPAAGFPMTVTDQAGRSVTLEKSPGTIVSGYYISTSALIALGLKDRLVGIEAKAEKRNIYRLAAPELIELPNVGSAKGFDLEACAALAPDLAILPLKLKDAAETLGELGIPVLLVNPESTALLEDMIDTVAKLTGTEDRAAALKAFTAETKARLSELEGETPTVYMSSNSDFLSTAGNGMYQAEMIRLAGGVNAADAIDDTYWANISYEQLLDWDPDVILLAAEAAFTVDDVLNDPALSEVSAVKNGRVYGMPDTIEAWDSPVPGAILGSVYTASILHDDMTEAEYQETVRRFYEEFYGFTPSEE